MFGRQMYASGTCPTGDTAGSKSFVYPRGRKTSNKAYRETLLTGNARAGLPVLRGYKICQFWALLAEQVNFGGKRRRRHSDAWKNASIAGKALCT